jgi:hypothetical protein
MTNQQHPITPPPELVQQWFKQAHESADPDNQLSYYDFIATAAAQWGADQELEACCEWTTVWISAPEASELRAARRPKPSSLKESALNALEHILSHSQTDHGANTIRRALEALDD